MDEKSREIREKAKLQRRFGKHLVKIREAKGITPAELARRCFMERSSIARLESGRINPSLNVLQKLANGLGIRLEEFFRDFE